MASFFRQFKTDLNYVLPIIGTIPHNDNKMEMPVNVQASNISAAWLGNQPVRNKT